MTDPVGAHSFTNDPGFDASLDALDRGLFRDERDAPDEVSPTPTERRALHDLFPPAAEFGFRPPGPLGGQRPPGPLIGTAAGPHLPDRFIADEAVAEPPRDSLADDGVNDLDLMVPQARVSMVLPPAITAFVLATLMLVGAAGAMWVFRDAVTRTIEHWKREPAGSMLRVPTSLAPIPQACEFV